MNKPVLSITNIPFSKTMVNSSSFRIPNSREAPLRTAIQHLDNRKPLLLLTTSQLRGWNHSARFSNNREKRVKMMIRINWSARSSKSSFKLREIGKMPSASNLLRITIWSRCITVRKGGRTSMKGKDWGGKKRKNWLSSSKTNSNRSKFSAKRARVTWQMSRSSWWSLSSRIRG